VRLRALKLTATRFSEALGCATITFNFWHDFSSAFGTITVNLLPERSLKVYFNQTVVELTMFFIRRMRQHAGAEGSLYLAHALAC